jgi:hypothetical protein
MPGKSSLQAVTEQLSETLDSLYWPKGSKYGLFINYAKMLESLDQRKPMHKLESKLGKHDPKVFLTKNIQDHEYLRLSDSLT